MHVIVERPTLERRVLGLARRRPDSRRARRLRHRAARRCLLRLERRARPRAARSTSTSPRRRRRRSAASRRRDRRRRTCRPPTPARRVAATPARGVRRACCATSTAPPSRSRRPSRFCSTSSSTSGRSRASRACGTCSASSSLASRRARRASCSRRGSRRACIDCCATRRRASRSSTCRRSTSPKSQAMALRFDGGRRDWAAADRGAGRGAVRRPRGGASTCCSHGLASMGPSRDPVAALAALFAPDGRAHRALPRVLRIPAAPRARLRRAQGHSRRARRDRAAEPDGDLAAPAAHAGLDQGLSVVARGRRPDHVAAASATRSTIRCCGSTCGSTAAPCRRPTTRSCARSARTRRRVCRSRRVAAGVR